MYNYAGSKSGINNYFNKSLCHNKKTLYTRILIYLDITLKFNINCIQLYIYILLKCIIIII